MKTATTLGVVLFISSYLSIAVAVKHNVFKRHGKVKTYVNKIGPENNPSEVYRYHSLPFCAPSKDEKNEKTLTLGEVMENNRMVESLADIRFKEHNSWVLLCEKTLSESDVRKFKNAIKRDYVYEILVDDLPVYGRVGVTVQTEDPNLHQNVTRYYLYNHVNYNLKYSPDNEVISCDISVDSRTGVVDITDETDTQVEFSYGVKWTETTIKWKHRMDKYIHYPLYERDREIQWFSIVNSMILVLLLTGLVGLIVLRILRRDMQKYLALDDDEFGEEADETGWKLLHGDVFRPPTSISLLSASLGVGTQIATSLLVLLFVALWGTFYPLSNRGGIQTALVFLYASTAGIAGFTSATMYKKLGGVNWSWNAILTATLFFGPLFLVFCFLNSVAIAYRSISALPAGTIVLFCFMWSLITFPLTILGAIGGKNSAGPFEAPCRVRQTPREVPEQPIWNTVPMHIIIGGFLPFSAIFIESFYIFDSIWGSKAYTLFGILFLTFIILICVVSCLTVALIYFMLSAEDYNWWWRSFIIGGSPAIFIYLYSIYYFNERSSMDGLLQVGWYFGYNAVGCWGFFLLLGTVGFFSALLFVKKIYATIKAA